MREPESVTSLLLDANQFIEEIKTTQFVGGNSVLHYTSSSDDQYDESVFADEERKDFVLRFDYDNAERYGIVYFTLYFRVDNPDVMANPQQPAPTAPEISVVYRERPEFNLAYSEFDITVFNNTYLGSFPEDFTVYMKFFFDGTDSGSWTLTEV